MRALHLKPCDRYTGTGLTVRLRRYFADGTPDPTDTIEWPHETCDKCGGSGMMQYDPATVVA